ncbi:MAG: nucleoside triphosphate pyrophosphohydrolase [Firmicutes bacterium]|nr:nucleoside triphosphate pyrophosphohydrolase [Bacillota bacterium]
MYNTPRAELQPLLDVMARLRSPEGCPWDRQQTHASLKRYLLEETYELLDAIDAGDDRALVEELGDVLLQVVFHAQIAFEEGRFSMDDVVRGLVHKLIRRHPHVFGDASANDAAAVARQWEEIKRREKAEQGSIPAGTGSILDSVSRHLPALMEAERVQARAAEVGFQWDNVEGAWEKVAEELAEVRAAGAGGSPDRFEEEWGDLLFALVNVARYAGIDPEQALRRASGKFRRRFRHIETRARELGKRLEDMTLAEMDALWEEAKR